MYAGVLPVLLEDFPEVHRKRFEYHTEMPLVEKVPKEPQAMVLVLWIRVV